MQRLINIIIIVGSICGSLITICGIVAAVVRRVLKINDIDGIKKEQCVLTYGVLACLDGLKQLGANGNVTEAKDKLDKYINQKAHDLEI